MYDSRIDKLFNAYDKQHNLKVKLLEGEKAVNIKGYEDYFITNYGRVFSLKKVLKTTTLEGQDYYAFIYKELSQSIVRGYKTVNLSFNKKYKKFYVHTLVFENFMGKFDTNFLRIIHINKDKLDNRLDNLTVEFRRKKDKNFIKEYYRRESFKSCLDIPDGWKVYTYEEGRQLL